MSDDNASAARRIYGKTIEVSSEKKRVLGSRRYNMGMIAFFIVLGIVGVLLVFYYQEPDRIRHIAIFMGIMICGILLTIYRLRLTWLVVYQKGFIPPHQGIGYAITQRPRFVPFSDVKKAYLKRSISLLDAPRLKILLKKGDVISFSATTFGVDDKSFNALVIKIKNRGKLRDWN
jgi:hypothetical protein